MSERSVRDLRTSPPAVSTVDRQFSPHGWLRPHERTPDLAIGARAGAASRKPLSPRHVPGAPGGFVPSDDDLLERTLAFSGSYVSDDGTVAIRRSGTGGFEYRGDRFVGHCTVCSRAALIAMSGEALADIAAAIAFAAAHRHGDMD